MAELPTEKEQDEAEFEIGQTGEDPENEEES